MAGSITNMCHAGPRSSASCWGDPSIPRSRSRSSRSSRLPRSRRRPRGVGMSRIALTFLQEAPPSTPGMPLQACRGPHHPLGTAAGCPPTHPHPCLQNRRPLPHLLLFPPDHPLPPNPHPPHPHPFHIQTQPPAASLQAESGRESSQMRHPLQPHPCPLQPFLHPLLQGPSGTPQRATGI